MPADQTIDVLFHEYMDDQKAVIRRVYAMAELPMTQEAEQQIDHYLNANPRGKHGKVSYDLSGDFGIDIPALRERFGFYYDRFPVAQENV
jgi:hypothetical protein